MHGAYEDLEMCCTIEPMDWLVKLMFSESYNRCFHENFFKNLDNFNDTYKL